MTTGFAMDFLLAGLLCATCIYCFVLNRRLRTLKDGQSDLQSAINTFDDATRRASETLKRLEENGIDKNRDLDISMAKANAMAAELSVMVSAGDNIASRIECAIGEVRAVGRRRTSGEQPKLGKCA